jgi:hypothetical protein
MNRYVGHCPQLPTACQYTFTRSGWSATTGVQASGGGLAIELAAARFAALGLDGLEAGLDQRLRFLTAGTGGADRHGSLREAIGWSYDLLSPDDCALLRRMAVFASGFAVDAACADVGAGRSGVRPGLRRRRRAGSLIDTESKQAPGPGTS